MKNFKLIFRIFTAVFIGMVVGGGSVLAEVQRPKVVLSSLEWPPYISARPDPVTGQQGYVHELLIAVMKEAGYDLEILFFPWARAIEMAKSGQVDGSFPHYFKETQQTDWGVLSDPFPGGPLVLYKRKDLHVNFSVDPRLNQAQSLKDLVKYTFGVVRSYANTETFDKMEYLKKEESNTDEANLRKLFNKRIDLAVIDKYVARYLLNQPMLRIFEDDVECMSPVLEEKAFYVNFSKQSKHYPQMVSDFNRAYQKLMQEGKIKAIIDNYGF